MENQFPRATATQNGVSLSPMYWLGFVVIILAGVGAASWLPYQRYSLNFGNYGTAPLLVARFSGAQALHLKGEWHSLSGNIVDSEVSRQMSLAVVEFGNTQEGLKLRLVVRNPTAWAVQQVIVGSFAPVNLPRNGSVASVPTISLIDCNIRPYSEGLITVSFSRGTDVSHLELLAVVGKRAMTQ